MKPGAWVYSWIKQGQENLLYLSLWLIGAPACLVLIFLVLKPSDASPPKQYQQAERWIEPIQGYTFDQNGFAAMMRQLPDFRSARWSRVELPDVMALPVISGTADYPEMARAWIRLRYTPEQVQQHDPIMLYGTRIMGGAYSVWVNGELIETSLDDWRMQWNTTLYAQIPIRHSIAGQPLDIYVSLPYRLAQGYSVGSLFVGPLHTVHPMREMRVFLQTTLPQAALLVALLLGLISFQFWLARRGETPHLLLTMTSIAWLVCNIQYFIDISDDEAAAVWFGAIVDVSISWLLPLMYMFALRFENRRFPRLEQAMVLYAVGMTIITLPAWGFQVTALLLHHYFDLFFAIGITLFITWLAVRGGEVELKVIVVALWSLIFCGAHDLYWLAGQRGPDGIHLFPYCTFMLFGAFLFSIQRRYIKAQITIESLNSDLEAKLQAREAELDAKHRQLRDIEQQQTLLKERQRLMQDMHDGIGSALMTSLVMAEKGQMPPDKIAVTLRECVDELKLVIDSLEPIGHDLGTLLGMLRYRLATRLEAAGIRVIWTMDDLPELDWLEPPQALQVLRILQEALTNILKHAQASEVRIAACIKTDHHGDTGGLVEIADNGQGFDAETDPRGRGLNNMRERARQLGATVEIQAVPGQGTRVRLWLPLSLPAAE